jgi:hypothetical protein
MLFFHEMVLQQVFHHNENGTQRDLVDQMIQIVQNYTE